MLSNDKFHTTGCVDGYKFCDILFQEQSK